MPDTFMRCPSVLLGECVRTLDLGGGLGRLRFHDLPGEGVPLVFVHGLGCASSCDYPRVATDPALADRRIVLLDLLGFGFSDKPVDFSYTVEDHARAVGALVSCLPLPAVDLFGFSMGGAVAIVVAASMPDRVRHLVLGEPNLDAGGGVFSRLIAEQREEEFAVRGHAELVREAVESIDPVWAGSLAVASPLAVYRGAVSLVRGGEPSWRGQLAELKMPRTVLLGARSLPHPDLDLLPGIGVATRVVADAGHSMSWENPGELARAIADSLA